MDKPKVKLFVFNLLVITLLLTQGCLLNNLRRSESGAIIGSYKVPIIPGWEKVVREDGYFSNVRYTHSPEEGVDVTLKFVKFPDIPEDEAPIRTQEELLNQVKKELKRPVSVADTLGMEMILISSLSREFLGMPAVEYEMALESDVGFSYKKVLRFIEDRHEYYLELTTSKNNKDYSHAQEGIDAWNRVINGLERVAQR